ncbi:MAG: hypothetical protein RL664_1120 [Bacteroidota bacterium]|jgi:hypothetical protein
MLDTAIGPITNVFDSTTFQMNVTHIGRHNKFRYNTFETVSVATNKTGHSLNQLIKIGLRVSCHVRHRDIYNRLVGDIYLE